MRHQLSRNVRVRFQSTITNQQSTTNHQSTILKSKTFYSLRKATTGSTLVARIAGAATAIPAVTMMTSGTVTNVTGSSGCTGNTSVPSDRLIRLGESGLNRPVRFVARKSMFSRPLIQHFYQAVLRRARSHPS